ncbi:hypothetical protein Acr_17g0001470 [Actinidia rufa]|uniref:Uncharacterized protein n=1 Tax=Actinidia rufa TaxID=165716 RepID=A0A7J0G1C0_9ERIC|nr:hypothetical protein Acr_17g0001470 [Actinidia rufa]
MDLRGAARGDLELPPSKSVSIFCCGKKLGEQPTVNIARIPWYWTSEAIKGRPAHTNRNKGPGRGRSKPLRRGDQTRAMTVGKIALRRIVECVERTFVRWWSGLFIDGVMGRVRGSRRDPRKDERESRKGQFPCIERILVEIEILSTLPRPRARRRQYFGSGRSDEYFEGGSGELSGDSLGPRPHPVKGLWMMGPRESRSPNRLSQKKARIDTGASRAPAKPPVASGAGSSAQRTLGEALGPQASVMASAATAEKILAGVILPADKEKVDKLTFDQVVTKFLHALGQGVILGSSLSPYAAGISPSALAEEKAKGNKLAEDADARSKVIAKLEARISELEKSQSLTQGRIIAAFKESDDFLEAMRGSTSSYFGNGFDFCKRQLVHQYPNLGVDLEDVEMDHEFLAKEEAEAEQKAAEERAAGAEGVGKAV